MFYELKHPLDADYFCLESGRDFEYPAHLHHCFEFLTVTEGEMKVEIDSVDYCVKKGSALLIFPNQIHLMSTPSHSRHTLCLFSPKLVSTFYERIKNKIPISNEFYPNEFYALQLIEFGNSNPILRKGLLYSLCGSFNANALYTDSPNEPNLLYKIFKFIEQNFKSDCSLHALSKSCGYSYTYISRYFKSSVGILYNSYVNLYRISHSCYLLRSTDDNILSVSEACGFNSLRSFNRVFLSEKGCSPAEYRKLK